MAASFLVALLLGSVLRDAFYPGSPAGRAPIEGIAGTGGPGTQGPQVPGPQPDRADGTRSVPATAEGGPWRMVTLSASGGPQGGPESIRLPAIERENIDDGWLRDFPAAMPAEVLQALKRTGHRVRQRRGLLPLRMQDGRRLVVPVDQVEVHYVGSPAL